MIVLDRADFRDRVLACWLGKSIGGTLGAPHECKRYALDLTFYDPVPTTAAANDDLDLQLVWLKAMEELGTTDPTVPQLAKAWASWAAPYPWNEYGFFMRNMERGLRPPVAGCFENYFVDEMGSPIRSEIWAVLHAGDPQAAARMAWKDSALDHAGGEGTWGEMFWAAVQAAAFVESDVQTLIRIGLNMIPLSSHLGRCIREAVWCHHSGLSYEAARARITERFAGLQPCNAVPNHGFTILGWLYGADFGDRLLKAVNCGWDTDCTGATLGATLGILGGTAGIPKRWIDPVGPAIVLHQFTRVPGAPTTVHDLTARSIALAEKAATPTRGFGDRAARPTDLPSLLLRNATAQELWRRDNHAGLEDLGGHELGLHYGGEPVLRPGEDKEVALSLDGVAVADARLTVPATWRCDALGGARFRLRCDGRIPGRNLLTAVLADGRRADFTILGPSEAQGVGAGDQVEKCAFCQARIEACICAPELAARIRGIRFIDEWLLAGPFKGPEPGRISLDVTAPPEQAVLGGERPQQGATWRRVRSSGGTIDLGGVFGGQHDWSFAYAWTEIDGGEGGPATLVCGSDDGIRIWLNGRQVHSHEIARASRPLDDEVAVVLKPGRNAILAKIDNYTAGWAFSIGVRRPT